MMSHQTASARLATQTKEVLKKHDAAEHIPKKGPLVVGECSR